MATTTTLAFSTSNSNFSRLKSHVPPIKAYFKGRNDGLDQVYLKGDNGKHYVLELDSNIEFYQPTPGAAKPVLEFMDGNESVSATLEYYDNESQSKVAGTSILNAINPSLGDAFDHLLDKATGVINYDYQVEHSKINDLKAEALEIKTFKAIFEH